MLTGADLLAKVKDLGDVSKSDLATACGYVSEKKGVVSESTSLRSTKRCSTLKALILVVALLVWAKVAASSLTKQPFKAMATC